MSTTTVPMHATVSAHLDVEKSTAARLSPPTPLALLATDDGLKSEDVPQRTFIVDLKSDSTRSSHAKEQEGGTANGTQSSGFDSIPSSPHETPSEVLPPIDVDVENHSTSEPNNNDSDSERSPIAPPGLNGQVPSPVPVQAGEPNRPEERVEQVDVPVQTPASDAPEELDAIFQLEPTLFQQDLSCYSPSGLPRLDTFIPDDLFPDDLLVHDISNITRLHPEDTVKDPAARHIPVRYVRISPKTSREQGDSRSAYDTRDTSKPARFAHLYLKLENRMGEGNHSYVYRAPLRLRLDPASGEWSEVTVAAKTANKECGAHLMLDKEAIAYSAFPRELMEDTLGVVPLESEADTDATDDATDDDDNDAAPSSDAAATSEESTGEPASISVSRDADCAGVASVRATPAETTASEMQVVLEQRPALVPKFYGYYGAVNANGSLHDERSEHKPQCNVDGLCRVHWPTRILLVEECGCPIEPRSLPREEREKVLKLTERLHNAGFVSGSSYPRNMLTQPGPLSVPREERSLENPSYRLIDFGRAEVLSLLSTRHRYFKQCCDEDMERAMRYLSLV